MLQILTHTPPWVFALFMVLLAFGLMQSRNRSVGRPLAFLLPIGMVALSLAGIHSSFGLEPMPIALWAAGLSGVTAIGYRLLPDKGITFDPERNTFFIPGSWLPLIVIMAIFFTKYLFAVMRALNIEAVNSPSTVVVLSLAFGCFSGYFAARAATLLSRSVSWPARI